MFKEHWLVLFVNLNKEISDCETNGLEKGDLEQLGLLFNSRLVYIQAIINYILQFELVDDHWEYINE